MDPKYYDNSAESGNETKEKTTEISSVTKVASVFEIFEIILKHLDVESLKNSRLVSQLWNKSISGILSHHIVINIDKFFDSSKSSDYDSKSSYSKGSSEVPYCFQNINIALIKNIKKGENVEASRHWKPLVEFCKMYGQYVTKIECNFKNFDINCYKMLKDAHKILTKLLWQPPSIPHDSHYQRPFFSITFS